MLKSFLKDESGATAIEYGLIAALIAVAISAGASSVGAKLTDQTGTVADVVSKATEGQP